MTFAELHSSGPLLDCWGMVYSGLKLVVGAVNSSQYVSDGNDTRLGMIYNCDDGILVRRWFVDSKKSREC